MFLIGNGIEPVTSALTAKHVSAGIGRYGGTSGTFSVVPYRDVDRPRSGFVHRKIGGGIVKIADLIRLAADVMHLAGR